MELRVVESRPDLVHIALSGKLDVEGEAQISDKFQELTSDDSKHVIVDMSEVTYLASLGIRLLFTSAKSLANGGKKMIVFRPQPMVEETLNTSGTVNFIPVAGDLDEAIGLI